LSECTKLTDIGIEKLRVCKNLIKLDLNSNNTPRSLVSAKSLANIAVYSRYLKVVLMRRCINVNDMCIEMIASNCLNLTSLNMGNCPLITDAALESLGKYCKNLKSINLTATKVFIRVLSRAVKKAAEKIENSAE